jgi:Tfp pilus assembly protein PilO
VKVQMTSASKAIVAMLAIAALATAFWVLALSPRRDETKKLGGEIGSVRSSLAEHRAQVREGLHARQEFPVDYEQLVVLGKAVPGDDDTASLLVQLNRVAGRAHVRFSDFTLSSEGGGSVPAAPAPAPEAESGGEGSESTPASSPMSPTEATASLLPLGASVGPAGLAVMPYSLTFEGSFFHLADFIQGLDALVKTQNEQVAVNGRLITIDGFSLSPEGGGRFELSGSFEVTTYVTPPGQGVTAGASPTAPAPATATPAAATLGGGS